MAFMGFRRRAWRRTVFAWAGFTWFACPEWPEAYIYPRIPLTDLLEQENQEEEMARLINEMETKEPITEPGKVVERIAELKKEADSLMLEKHELA